MLGVAEDVRMAAFHLVANAVEDVVEREFAGFLGHLRVEDDLELEIAELVGERVHVVARDRVGDLIGFLDRVGRDGRECLHAVPFAAADADRAGALMIAYEALKAQEGFSIGVLRHQIQKYDNMHYVKCTSSQGTRTSHRPSTPQRWSDDRKFMPRTLKSSSSAMCTARFWRSMSPTSKVPALPVATRMKPFPVRTIWLRVALTGTPTRAAVFAADRRHGRAAVDQELHALAVYLPIDPEMAVDRHRDADFLAFLDRLAGRLRPQALGDIAKIVAEREQDEAAGEDRNPGQRHGQQPAQTARAATSASRKRASAP